MRCACGSTDYDVDWGQCFECFCADRPQQRQQEQEFTEADMCASYGHPEYIAGHGQCYCGVQLYLPAEDPSAYRRFEAAP